MSPEELEEHRKKHLNQYLYDKAGNVTGRIVRIRPNGDGKLLVDIQIPSHPDFVIYFY